MHIRKSKIKDRTAVLRIARTHKEAINLKDKKDMLDEHIGTDKVIVACDDNNHPIGFVYAYMRGKGHGLYNSGRDHLYVSAVCVDTNHQRKGVATAMLHELTASNSHRKIRGYSLSNNEAGSKLYTKVGFVPGESRTYYIMEADKGEEMLKISSAHLRPFEVKSDIIPRYDICHYEDGLDVDSANMEKDEDGKYFLVEDIKNYLESLTTFAPKDKTKDGGWLKREDVLKIFSTVASKKIARAPIVELMDEEGRIMVHGPFEGEDDEGYMIGGKRYPKTLRLRGAGKIPGVPDGTGPCWMEGDNPMQGRRGNEYWEEMNNKMKSRREDRYDGPDVNGKDYLQQENIEGYEKLKGSSKKWAMDFTSIKPILDKDGPISLRELERATRLSIASEEDATHLYELIADKCPEDYPELKELFQDVANEEKVHVGEFQAILDFLSDDSDYISEGREEAKDIGVDIPSTNETGSVFNASKKRLEKKLSDLECSPSQQKVPTGICPEGCEWDGTYDKCVPKKKRSNSNDIEIERRNEMPIKSRDIKRVDGDVDYLNDPTPVIHNVTELVDQQDAVTDFKATNIEDEDQDIDVEEFKVGGDEKPSDSKAHKNKDYPVAKNPFEQKQDDLVNDDDETIPAGSMPMHDASEGYRDGKTHHGSKKKAGFNMFKKANKEEIDFTKDVDVTGGFNLRFAKTFSSLKEHVSYKGRTIFTNKDGYYVVGKRPFQTEKMARRFIDGKLD